MTDPGDPLEVAGAVGPAGPPGRWGLGDVWITLALYVLFAFVGAGVVLAAPDTPDARAWALVASVALPWIGLAGWPLLATGLKGQGPVQDLRLRGGRGDLAFGAAAGVVGLVCAALIATLTELVMGDQLESSVGQLADTLAEASPWPVIALALLAVFAAPVVEEIAFRGLMFGALAKRGWAVWPNIVLTAAVFSAFHLEVSRFALLFVVGIVLGYVRARTRSTSASMVAHLVNNLPGGIALVALALG